MAENAYSMEVLQDKENRNIELLREFSFVLSK